MNSIAKLFLLILVFIFSPAVEAGEENFKIEHLKSFDATNLGIGKTHTVSLSVSKGFLWIQKTNPLTRKTSLHIFPKGSLLGKKKPKGLTFNKVKGSSGTLYRGDYWTVGFSGPKFTFYCYKLKNGKLAPKGKFSGESSHFENLKGVDKYKLYLSFCFYSKNKIYLTWWREDHKFVLYLFSLNPKEKKAELKEKIGVRETTEPCGITFVDYFLISCNDYWRLQIIDTGRDHKVVYTKDFSGNYPGPLPEPMAIAYDGEKLWTYNWDSFHSETIEVWRIKVPQTNY